MIKALMTMKTQTKNAVSIMAVPFRMASMGVLKMKKLKVTIFVGSGLLLSSLIFCSTAYSATGSSGSRALLSANFGMFNSKDETETTVNHDTQVTNTDINVGYIFSSGFYLGGMYGSSATDRKGDATKPTMTHQGVSIGYFSTGGFFIQAHYLMSGEIVKATATANRIGGTGNQIDLGFVKNLKGVLFLGAQISSRTVEYTKLDTSGVETESKHSVVDLFPALRLSFIW